MRLFYAYKKLIWGLFSQQKLVLGPAHVKVKDKREKFWNEMFRYWIILTNIIQYYLKVNQYCTILSNIVQYYQRFSYPVLFNIVQVTISAHSCLCCDGNLEYSDIVCNHQMLPNIVVLWLTLSSIDQYCPVAPSVTFSDYS